LFKKSVSAVLFSLLVSSAHPPLAQKNSQAPLRHELVGTWKLVSMHAKHADGRITSDPDFGPNPAGYLMYDASGHMCTEFMNPDRFDWRNPDNPAPQEAKAAVDGYEAYCGTYEIHEAQGIVVHRKELALVPNAAGTTAERSVSFSGKRLVLKMVEKARGGEPLSYISIWERVN
jgi:lipocalin-like protein